MLLIFFSSFRKKRSLFLRLRWPYNLSSKYIQFWKRTEVLLSIMPGSQTHSFFWDTSSPYLSTPLYPIHSSSALLGMLVYMPTSLLQIVSLWDLSLQCPSPPLPSFWWWLFGEEASDERSDGGYDDTYAVLTGKPGILYKKHGSLSPRHWVRPILKSRIQTIPSTRLSYRQEAWSLML